MYNLLRIYILDHSLEVVRADLNCHHGLLNAFKFKGNVAVVTRLFDCGEDLINRNVTVAENGGAAEVAASGAVKSATGIVGHTALDK